MAAAHQTPAESSGEEGPRIGLLGVGSGSTPNIEAFLQRLHELGWEDGFSIFIAQKFAQGQQHLIPDHANDLAHMPLALIVAIGTPAIRAARDAAQSVAPEPGGAIPIVMALAGDPVASGLVKYPARPEANLTGTTTVSSQLSGKRMGLLKEALPTMTRVAVLSNPDNVAKAQELAEALRAARRLGVQAHPVYARQPADLAAAFDAASEWGAEAIIVQGDPVTQTNRSEVVGLASDHGLPAMYETREFVDIGGLMAYGPNLPYLYRQTAAFVDKILRGTAIRDLRVEPPSRFDFVIKQSTIDALKLTIPQPVLDKATEIIE